MNVERVRALLRGARGLVRAREALCHDRPEDHKPAYRLAADEVAELRGSRDASDAVDPSPRRVEIAPLTFQGDVPQGLLRAIIDPVEEEVFDLGPPVFWEYEG